MEVKNNMTKNIEERVVQLISVDRADTAFSSWHQKLSRQRKTLAGAVSGEIEKKYRTERVFANLMTEPNQKARGYVDGVKEFEGMYPKYGRILRGIIEQKRVEKEEYLEFGLRQGSKLTVDDYLAVMQDIGLTEGQARSLYPSVFQMGRNLQKARGETRSILLS